MQIKAHFTTIVIEKKKCIFISISEDTIIIIHLFISLYQSLLESLDSILSCPHVNFKKQLWGIPWWSSG